MTYIKNNIRLIILSIIITTIPNIKIYGTEILIYKTTKSPYLISKDLVISSEQKLIVQEGVVIKISKGVRFAILGKCDFQGTQAKPIIITSENDLTPNSENTSNISWSGILLKNATECIFSNTIFKNGGNNSTTKYSAIYCSNSNLILEYCKFLGSKYKGISLNGNSNADLGKGDNNSKGYNIFRGYGKPNYAVFNISNKDIIAKNNCWGSTDIELQIYDRNDKQSLGNIVCLPIAATCIPQKPKTPKLIYPQNNSIGMPRSTNIKWSSIENANHYSLQIDDDFDFSSPKIDVVNIKDTVYRFMSTKYGKTYFWKIKAINFLGESVWSSAFKFSVYDTAKPKVVELQKPNDAELLSLCLPMKFEWKCISLVEKFQLVISDDSAFSNIILLDSNIVEEYNEWQNFEQGKSYYWKVRAKNENGWGEYSLIQKFKISANMGISDSIPDANIICITDINSDNNNDILFTDNENNLKYININDNNSITNEINQNANNIIVDNIIVDNIIVGNFANNFQLDYINFMYDRTELFINDGAANYTKLNLSLFPIPYLSNIADFDGDRDVDILISGIKDDTVFTKILLNDFPVFNEKNLDVSYFKTIEKQVLLDYDKDGNIDIIISGVAQNGTNYSALYLNNYPNYSINQTFTYTILNTFIHNDMLNYVLKKEYGLYVKNEFEDIQISDLQYDGVEIADLNNDGKIDIIAYTNDTVSIHTVRVFYKLDSLYSQPLLIAVNGEINKILLNDYDNDNDLDCFVSCENNTFLLKNFTCEFNKKPEIPQNIRYTYSENNIILEWDKSTDEQTEINQFQYSIELKNTQGNMLIKHISNTGSKNSMDWANIVDINYFVLKDLPTGIYEWRVCSIDNANNFSDYSSWQKVYTKGLTPLPPKSWLYDKKTGSNATIIVRKNPMPELEGQVLKAGDAIGVFYISGKEMICGGYSVLTGNDNIAITVWGDNMMTKNLKDGFANHENLRFKLWLAADEKVLPVYGIFEKGNDYYEKDFKYILSGFTFTDTLKIPIKGGSASFISSNLSPYQSNIADMTNNENIKLKNDDDAVYGSTDKNPLIYWRDIDGYVIYSEENDTLTIYGNVIEPDNKNIEIESNKWRLIPNYLKNKIDIIDVFEPIVENIIAAKDDQGNYYIPNENINTLKYISENNAYMLYTDEDCNFTYSSNLPIYKDRNQTQTNKKNFKFFSQCDLYTGRNMLIIIDNTFIDDGDEIAVKNGNTVFGTAIAEQGRCVVTVWGDNDLTEEIEAVSKDNKLTIELYKPKHSKIYGFNVTNNISILNNKSYNEVVYQPNEIIKAIGKFEDYSSVNENINFDIYPNPCKNYFNIDLREYVNKINKINKIELYNITGNILLEKNILFGENIIKFDVNNLTNGVYLIKLYANNAEYIKKLKVRR